MAIPNSRQSLIEYALRRLGAPVIRIEVDELQLDDLVDDAVQLFQEYHFDGSNRLFVTHQVTQQNKDDKSIPVPDTIHYIHRILPIRATGSSAGIFDIRYQIHLNDIFDLAYAGTISHYYQTKQYLDLLEQVIHGEDEFQFSRLEDKIYLQSLDWERIDVGKYIVIEAQVITDPEAYTEFYNDRWLKQYVTALFKRQWGSNVKKYENTVLPGGSILNGQAMYDEADTEVKELEENLRAQYEAPLGLLIG